MNLKSLFSRLTVSRLDHQARLARRALRDFQRHEMSRIRSIEIRARGIRLYAAWSRKPANGASHSTWQTLGAPALA